MNIYKNQPKHNPGMRGVGTKLDEAEERMYNNCVYSCVEYLIYIKDVRVYENHHQENGL